MSLLGNKKPEVRVRYRVSVLGNKRREVRVGVTQRQHESLVVVVVTLLMCLSCQLARSLQLKWRQHIAAAAAEIDDDSWQQTKEPLTLAWDV